jgi:hypothetical protein
MTCGPGALRITTAVRLGSARRENAGSRSTIMTCAQAFAHVRLASARRPAFRKLVGRFVSVNGTLRECRLVDDHSGNQGSSRPRLNIGRKFMRPHWRKIDLICSING